MSKLDPLRHIRSRIENTREAYLDIHNGFEADPCPKNALLLHRAAADYALAVFDLKESEEEQAELERLREEARR